jgi:hypothetical protein
VNHLGMIAAALLASGSLTSAAFAQPAKTAAQAADAPVALSGPGSVAGIWAKSDYDRGRVFDPRKQSLKTIDGKTPPFRPEAAKLYEQRLVAAEHDQVFVTPLSQCLPSGIPAMMFYPGLPIQFLESRGEVIMLNEQLTNWRKIYMGGKHQDDPDPSFFGDSVAHWEKGVLVVDTIGLITDTTLDQPGMPHSDALHVTERYRRMDKNTLELKVTIDDPKIFTQPWDAITHFKLAPSDRRIEEYICENNRNTAKNGAISTKVN